MLFIAQTALAERGSFFPEHVALVRACYWSTLLGCVLGELLLGRPLFAGETSVDQLVKIIQVLGTPTRRQMATMNPNYTEFRFPDVKPREWKVVSSEQVCLWHTTACQTKNRG